MIGDFNIDTSEAVSKASANTQVLGASYIRIKKAELRILLIEGEK